MEMVYCNFLANQNGTTCAIFACYCLPNSFLFTDKQKWIGYADVKSAPVHFYVQKNYTFTTKGTPIPFELARVNEGDAVNLSSGVFTAPRPGTYFFSFTGTAHFSSTSSSGFSSVLYLNGKIIGASRVEEGNSTENQKSPLTLQSTLNLKKGDRVWVQMSHTGTTANFYLYDDIAHSTHFTGFMLEEEIITSL